MTDGDVNAVQMEYYKQAWTVTAAQAIYSTTMAQGNTDQALTTAGTADERGDSNMTYTYTLINGTKNAVADTATILNLPTIGDADGSTFTLKLESGVSVATNFVNSSTPLNATVMYSTSLYQGQAGETSPDLAGYVTADQGIDWSAVRSIYITYGDVPVNSSTGRVTIIGEPAETLLGLAQKVGYLQSFTYFNDAPVSIETTKAAASITITGESTVKSRFHYVDNDGVDQYIDLPDLTQTLSDNQDTLADALTALTDFSTADQALVPKDYYLDSSTVVDGTGDGAAQPGQTAQYFFDGDTVQYELVKDVPSKDLDTVTKTVHFLDHDGNEILPDYTDSVTLTQYTDAVDGTLTYEPTSAILPATFVPAVNGYYVVSYPAGVYKDDVVKFGDQDIVYTVYYNKNSPSLALDTVTKTVHYVDQDGKAIAPDYTVHANFTETTDAVDGSKAYGPESAELAGQANPTITGYHVVTNPAGATTAETVAFGDKDLEYTVVYNKDTPAMALDTVTKTVHYVDQDGKLIAPDYTVHANFTQLTDAVSGDKTTGPESAQLAGQANPMITGYHVVTNPTGATSTETVKFGDTDLEYTVVYNKNTPSLALDTVTKTVHYVDQDGKKIAPDYTVHANFTETTDAVDGSKAYGPESAGLAGQANPTITGYHVVTNPAGATTAETVHFGDSDLDYTVVYNKNTPSLALDTVTKTVHYIDQDGKTIAPDYTAHANFTETTDAADGSKAYGPESAALAGQANPIVAGYHVVTNPTGATSTETVKFGDADLEYTVVYNKDTPDMSLDTVTKTVHFVDQDGKTIAPDYTVSANFTQLTDPVDGKQSYGPTSATLAGTSIPTIEGYYVVSYPVAVIAKQTVQYGDPDLEYTVMYNKDTPSFALDTVTKTVHYVDQDGKKIAPDYTVHVNFTETTDAVDGSKAYGPESAELAGQANPTITGYHVVTNPAGATTAETVHFGDSDLEYTVVYNKDTPAMALDTVTKIVHYVDQDGKMIAPDYTTHANFTELTDAVDGTKTYGPESATLVYQADPVVAGYHVVTSPAEATANQAVKFGDADAEYFVIYAKNQTTPGGTDSGTSSTPGGTDSGTTSTPSGTDSSTSSTPSGTDSGTSSTPGGTDSGTTSTPSGTDSGTTSTPSGTDSGTTSTPSGTDSGTISTPSGTDSSTSSTPSGTDSGTSSTPSGSDSGTTSTPSGTSSTPDSDARVTLPNTNVDTATTKTVATNVPAKVTRQQTLASGKQTTHQSLPQTGDQQASLLALLGAGMASLFGLALNRKRRH